jgi:hypothetical protein
MSEHRERPPTPDEVIESQVHPVAGIWYCDNCGRRIQVITDGDRPELQSFTCVCGTPMQPGEEHSQPGPDLQGRVIDQ